MQKMAKLIDDLHDKPVQSVLTVAGWVVLCRAYGGRWGYGRGVGGVVSGEREDRR